MKTRRITGFTSIIGKPNFGFWTGVGKSGNAKLLFLILFCFLLPRAAAFPRSWSIAANAGPSLSFPSKNATSVNPIWTWNAGLDLMHSGKKSFEWGIGLNLNHLPNYKLYDYRVHVADVVSLDFRCGFQAWNWNEENSIAVGVSLGFCGAKDDGGMAGGLYIRYRYALSERFDLTAALQPKCYIFMYPPIFGGSQWSFMPTVSLPLSFGVAFKF